MFRTAFPLLILSGIAANAAEPISYNRDIRPILAENCFSCHGPDKASREAKMRLDLRENALEKKAFVAGNSKDSELVYLINSTDEEEVMPPPDSHKSLTAAEKKLLADWIDQGAEYEPHWAYIRAERPQVPAMGASNPIDNFILARLKAKNRIPSPRADDATLARRVSFDITGLPPAQTGAKADGSGIEALLASPHYGERMAVFWLDLARYADTVGYHGDNDRDTTPYRDYVIEAFNTNKPYDVFILQQLAGDLLEKPTTENYIASAFNRLNQISGEGGIQDEEYIAKYRAERVRTTSVAFLGSTLGCAECHDHKFDPFSAHDFYSMGAFFADVMEKGAYNGDGKYNEGTDIKNYPGFTLSRWGPSLSLPSEEQKAGLEKLAKEKQAAEAGLKQTSPELEAAFGKWITELRASAGEKGAEKALAGIPEPSRKALLKNAEEELPAADKTALFEHYRKTAPTLAPLRKDLERITKEEKALQGKIRSTLVTLSAKPRETRLLPRGNWTDRSGEVMQPSAPSFLISTKETGKEGAKESPRQTRLDLAKWIASRDNPLTARAFTNRVWAMFFGTGLSRDLQDLGNQGRWPTHPELLDWLSVEFMESGWDVKHLVKLIVTSQTYQQSSNVSAEMLETDPYNLLYARQNPRRLPAEFVRDNALAVSGLLNNAVGGESARPYQPEGYYAQLNFPVRVYQPDRNEGQYRRGVYMHWQRSFLHPMLMAFDAPAREECTASRESSNTPLQALNLLNDPTFVEAARVLAERVLKENPDTQSRIRAAFQHMLGRAPHAEELTLMTELHDRQKARYALAPEEAKALTEVGMKPAAPELNPVDLSAFTAVTRTLFNLHETITRY